MTETKDFDKIYITLLTPESADENYDDPEKLIDWLESSINVEEVLNKSKNKNNEGAVGTSIVGAKKEDLAKIGADEQNVSLHKEAEKMGGTLSMTDLMKLHGIN